jgi:hypothetical protein
MKKTGELGYGLALCDTTGLKLIKPHTIEIVKGLIVVALSKPTA